MGVMEVWGRIVQYLKDGRWLFTVSLYCSTTKALLSWIGMHRYWLECPPRTCKVRADTMAVLPVLCSTSSETCLSCSVFEKSMLRNGGQITEHLWNKSHSLIRNGLFKYAVLVLVNTTMLGLLVYSFIKNVAWVHEAFNMRILLIFLKLFL